MTRLVALLILLVLFVPAAAPGNQLAGNTPRDPEANFEHAWRSIDRTYGQFSVKNVDWAMLYRVFRPQVTAETTDEELWDILVTMLGTLNDAHVCLADGKRRICGGIGPAELTPETWARDFSLDLVKSKYLHGKSSDSRGGTFTSGWLTDQIGYLHMADLKGGNEPTAQAIDGFLGEFARAQALVIDVRANPGGSNQNHEIVASRFADRRRQYAESQVRYGPKHDDLLPTEYRDVEPDGPVQFTRSVVLLTHRSTASGPEGLTLAMRVLPHVTVVGDLTEGALSAQFPDRLPNGWTLWVAFKVTRDHEGICWDGIGIPPDIRVVNTSAEIAEGTDRQLELALRLLERGTPAPQDESASLAQARTSLVREYDRAVRAEGVEAAVAALTQARAASADTAFFGIDEAMQLATRYLGSKQYPAAIGLLEASREEFPRLAAMYAMLAQAWLGVGEVTKAEAVLSQGDAVEPMYPWERPQIERAKFALRKAKLGSAAIIFGRALADGGVPAAETKLQELQAGREAGPVFDENDFNALGYQLLQEGSVQSAVYVFKKTAQLYPDSWNAHDSLGEALLKAGRKEEAIQHYRKSLELNPRNQGAKKILEDLGR
jgi:carboxyl-terminal processing protease